MSPNAKPALIALDWGTSRLRAYLLDANGAVLDSRSDDHGVLNVPDGDFERVFQTLVRPWLAQYGSLPAVASGMIGSRQGWREVPYLDCPAAAADLASQLSAIATGNAALWLVPGLRCADAQGVPDVMRGEETQIVGALDSGEAGERCFILPGTHSKWVRVKDERIMDFITFMSGELYAVLREHSILGRLMDGGDDDPGGFQRGLRNAAGGLGRRLFSVRSLGLAGQLPAEALPAYLSGLIIGDEIEQGLAWLGGASVPLRVIGETRLGGLYLTALRQRGIAAGAGPEDAAVRGLYRIARSNGEIVFA